MPIPPIANANESKARRRSLFNSSGDHQDNAIDVASQRAPVVNLRLAPAFRHLVIISVGEGLKAFRNEEKKLFVLSAQTLPFDLFGLSGINCRLRRKF